MAKHQRETTQYPGVFWLTIQGAKTLYIRYKRPGTDKAVEEKLGSKAQGWTAPRGNAEWAKRINWQAKSNAEQREPRIAERLAEESQQTLDRLWDAYLESKGFSLKGLVTDNNRYELHLQPEFGNKTPDELAPPDVDKMRQELLKNHSNGTSVMYWNYCAALSILESVNSFALPSVGPSNFLNQILTPSALKCSPMSSSKSFMRFGHPTMIDILPICTSS